MNRGLNYLDLLLRPLGRLTHLDLSGFHHNERGDLSALARWLPQLTSLVLHNSVLLGTEAFKTICQIKTLR